MRFDKSRVYTALNADELKEGSKVILADDMLSLRKYVEQENCLSILKRVCSEDCMCRFESHEQIGLYALAYLVAEPSSLKWTDLKVGDVIQRDGLSFMVVGKDDVSDTHMHIFIGGTQWLSDETLKAYRKVN